MGLKNLFEKMEPDFHKGGKYEKYYTLSDIIASILI